MSLFGGKDPFDDPFFTRPFDYLFGGKSPFNDPFFTGPFDSQAGSRKQITIEELNPDDDYNSPKDSNPSKDLVVKNPTDNSSWPNTNSDGIHSFSYRKVAYGGSDGMYYTSAVARRTGGDGLVMMEMKEEDKTKGEALHTISRGMKDKGHSVTTKHNPGGNMDSVQTLHNLNEDELNGFEEAWKVNADRDLAGWNNGLNLLKSAETGSYDWDSLANWAGWGGWALPWAKHYGDSGAIEPYDESRTRGQSKKVVPVNIE